MSGKLLAAMTLATALTAGTAHAETPHQALGQLAGVSTDLGHNASALTYWVDAADGIHVVTTIDTVTASEVVPEQDRHAVVRFSALILPGQSEVISVPGPIGSQQLALRIRRLDDQTGNSRIEVERISSPPVNEIVTGTPTN